MNYSFLIKRILILSAIACFFSLSLSLNAQEPALPTGDNGSDADGSLLPPRDDGDTSNDAPLIDVGMPPPTNTTAPTSQNDAASQGTIAGQQAGQAAGSAFGQAANPSGSTNPVTAIFDQIAPSSMFGGQPLSNLLNQIFYIGLAIAVVLAIVMIVRGGIQYMTIDAWTSKESGKKMVQAALGGLVLAFASILILNTINPNLTTLNLSFGTIQQTGIVDQQIISAVAAYNALTPEQRAQMLATGKIPEGISPAAQAILAEALNAVGNMKTGAIPGTDGGNKACAAALNAIVQAATGQPVGGGLSTAAMNTALQNNPKYALVSSDGSNYQPGDIVISPTSGGATGHVGIVASVNGDIISNSSSNAEVRQNYTMNSWKTRYDGKGLPTYVYRPL